jgi:hypothetical protein
VPQIREILIHLLLPTPPSCTKIARVISRVLRRTEEARIYSPLHQNLWVNSRSGNLPS